MAGLAHLPPMKAAQTLSSFHHWLLDADQPGAGLSRVLVLHGSQMHPELSGEIADYLNQYDEDSRGRWIAMHPSLIEAIARDASQRRLLGMADPCPNCPPAGPCGLRKVVRALAGHGHIVIDSPHAPVAADAAINVFHVSLEPGHDGCHLQLNPDCFRNHILAPIIGDVYLEWLNCGMVSAGMS